MKIAYRGNFGPTFSTESHVAASLESLGHEVVRQQEDDCTWQETFDASLRCDLFLWTSTWGFAHKWNQEEAWEKFTALAGKVPRASFHLDRFWGLNREDQVTKEPWFRADVVFTADGGHQKEFSAAGIRHVWLPPAVYHAEAIDERPRERYKADVAFVGSWQGYGHPEWEPYRMELLDRVRGWFGKGFRCFPADRAIRGHELNRLYASVKVVLGDSCLSGGIKRFWSDRVPETLGRGGFIVHPYVEGFDNIHPYVPTWQLGDWDHLHYLLSAFLEHPGEREAHRVKGAADVRANHTYRNRVSSMLCELKNWDVL